MEYSIKETLEKLGMTLINVDVKGFKLTFDIDTGSTENIVFDFVTNQLGDVFRPIKGSTKVFGIEGDYKETPFVGAELYIGEQKYMTQFNVVNADQTIINLQNDFGFQLHGILGVPFLVDNGRVIDFKKKILIINR